MSLAVVRSIDAPRALTSPVEFEEFEQELVDQYLLASSAAGLCDSTLSSDRSVIFEFARFIGRPLWTAGPADADRFLHHQRTGRGNSHGTVQRKAVSVAQFFDFLIGRYQGDIHALTGHVVLQVIDEFNRPAKTSWASQRLAPPESEVDELFSQWRAALPTARKYLPAARDYLAASLWRKVGLRIQETYMLDIRDWRRDVGDYGTIQVRFGKGSGGRGPKFRLVPALDQVDALLDWWLTDVRHQFGDDYQDPDAPLLPSERFDRHTGCRARIGDQALRDGLAAAIARWLPRWRGVLTPHGLRHFCASTHYIHGMDIKAIQDLLGHEWLSTTTGYIHVPAEHIEKAWAKANERTAARLARAGW